MRIGERVRQLRELAGLSQSELAQRAGIRRATLNELESGKSDDMKLSMAVQIADVLQVPLDLLAGRKP